jgi:hypothetical protein
MLIFEVQKLLIVFKSTMNWKLSSVQTDFHFSFVPNMFICLILICVLVFNIKSCNKLLVDLENCEITFIHGVPLPIFEGRLIYEIKNPTNNKTCMEAA